MMPTLAWTRQAMAEGIHERTPFSVRSSAAPATTEKPSAAAMSGSALVTPAFQSSPMARKKTANAASRRFGERSPPCHFSHGQTARRASSTLNRGRQVLL